MKTCVYNSLLAGNEQVNEITRLIVSLQSTLTVVLVFKENLRSSFLILHTILRRVMDGK